MRHVYNKCQSSQEKYKGIELMKDFEEMIWKKLPFLFPEISSNAYVNPVYASSRKLHVSCKLIKCLFKGSMTSLV